MKLKIHPKFLPLQKEGGYNRNNEILCIRAFTLVEIMVWILIVSIVIIWWFQALSAITIWKAKLIQKVDMQKESFYFTEKLFEMIKQWWTLDYEEYFNRSVIWNTTYLSWHFAIPSWFWNFWKGWILWTTNYWENKYYCRSIDNDNIMTWTWCVTNYNSGTLAWVINYSWEHQRYWQYALQFIDYNSNNDSDWWDEDGDGDIIWDDDDEFLWDWPEVFASGASMPELYLISGDKKTRTYFRWSVKQDPNAWSGAICDTATATGSGCLGTVEYIRLLWKDWWEDHDFSVDDSTQNDWLIDTWVIDPEINWVSVASPTVAWNSSVNWVPLFSDAISVSEFKIYSFPNKDLSLAWKSADKSINVSPYTIIKIKLKPSWITKRKIWWDWEELDFSMTINLSDIYSN